jgi:hypothetical protein
MVGLMAAVSLRPVDGRNWAEGIFVWSDERLESRAPAPCSRIHRCSALATDARAGESSVNGRTENGLVLTESRAVSPDTALSAGGASWSRFASMPACSIGSERSRAAATCYQTLINEVLGQPRPQGRRVGEFMERSLPPLEEALC